MAVFSLSLFIYKYIPHSVMDLRGHRHVRMCAQIKGVYTAIASTIELLDFVTVYECEYGRCVPTYVQKGI